MLKGVIFSLASKTEVVKNECYRALKIYLKDKPDLQIEV